MTAARVSAEDVLESLTRVIDPAYGINLVDLGLVYGIEVAAGVATIRMTLTDPDTPSRKEIEAGINRVARLRHPGLHDVFIDYVWDPPWRDDFITDAGNRQMQAPIVPMPDSKDAPLTGDDLRESLKFVIDPEVGLNVVDLGLVYGVELAGTSANIIMTLTTPGCPLHASIEAAVKRTLETRHPQLTSVEMELVWEPKWDTDRITENGRHQLGW